MQLECTGRSRGSASAGQPPGPAHPPGAAPHAHPAGAVALPCTPPPSLHPADPGVAWLVQVSDIHVSKFMHHDIVDELVALGHKVLAGIRPQAVLLTGEGGAALPTTLLRWWS